VVAVYRVWWLYIQSVWWLYIESLLNVDFSNGCINVIIAE